MTKSLWMETMEFIITAHLECEAHQAHMNGTTVGCPHTFGRRVYTRCICVWEQCQRKCVTPLGVDSTRYLIHPRCFLRVVGSVHLTPTFLSTSLLTHTHFAFSSTYFHASRDSDRDEQSGGRVDERQNCNPSLHLQLALISVYFY